MNIIARAYRDPADLAAMRQLLVLGSQANIAASYMHPGALDWAVYYPPDEAENRCNLLLWESENGELAAWAIYNRHEGTFDLFVAHGLYDTAEHATIMGEYVAWAEARAHKANLKQLAPFWVLDHDRAMDRLLQANGFARLPCDPAPPLFERSLAELPAVRLPDGYTVQGVQNLEDGQQRAAVSHGAFRPNADWERYWAEYAGFIGSAVYNGERDLFVRAPDGRGASACTIWFDHANKVGLFEPVATHPAFQGKGLGKAVMSEGMRRMQAAGMQRAVLGFDPNNQAARALYTSLGFQATAYFAVYSKAI
jgi:mycothiol synthase